MRVNLKRLLSILILTCLIGNNLLFPIINVKAAGDGITVDEDADQLIFKTKSKAASSSTTFQTIGFIIWIESGGDKIWTVVPMEQISEDIVGQYAHTAFAVPLVNDRLWLDEDSNGNTISKKTPSLKTFMEENNQGEINQIRDFYWYGNTFHINAINTIKSKGNPLGELVYEEGKGIYWSGEVYFTRNGNLDEFDGLREWRESHARGNAKSEGGGIFTARGWGNPNALFPDADLGHSQALYHRTHTFPPLKIEGLTYENHIIYSGNAIETTFYNTDSGLKESKSLQQSVGKKVFIDKNNPTAEVTFTKLAQPFYEYKGYIISDKKLGAGDVSIDKITSPTSGMTVGTAPTLPPKIVYNRANVPREKYVYMLYTKSGTVAAAFDIFKGGTMVPENGSIYYNGKNEPNIPVTLKDSGSTSLGGTIEQREWSIMNYATGKYDLISAPMSNDEEIDTSIKSVHVMNGYVTFNLKVIDNNNNDATATKSVQLVPQLPPKPPTPKPIADYTHKATVNLNSAIGYKDMSAQRSSAKIVKSVFKVTDPTGKVKTYEYKNGDIDPPSSIVATEQGLHSTSLTVTDENGKTASKSDKFNVTYTPPSAPPDMDLELTFEPISEIYDEYEDTTTREPAVEINGKKLTWDEYNERVSVSPDRTQMTVQMTSEEMENNPRVFSPMKIDTGYRDGTSIQGLSYFLSRHPDTGLINEIFDVDKRYTFSRNYTNMMLMDFVLLYEEDETMATIDIFDKLVDELDRNKSQKGSPKPKDVYSYNVWNRFEEFEKWDDKFPLGADNVLKRGDSGEWYEYTIPMVRFIKESGGKFKTLFFGNTYFGSDKDYREMYGKYLGQQINNDDNTVEDSQLLGGSDNDGTGIFGQVFLPKDYIFERTTERGHEVDDKDEADIFRNVLGLPGVDFTYKDINGLTELNNDWLSFTPESNELWTYALASEFKDDMMYNEMEYGTVVVDGAAAKTNVVFLFDYVPVIAEAKLNLNWSSKVASNKYGLIMSAEGSSSTNGIGEYDWYINDELVAKTYDDGRIQSFKYDAYLLQDGNLYDEDGNITGLTDPEPQSIVVNIPLSSGDNTVRGKVVIKDKSKPKVTDEANADIFKYISGDKDINVEAYLRMKQGDANVVLQKSKIILDASGSTSTTGLSKADWYIVPKDKAIKDSAGNVLNFEYIGTTFPGGNAQKFELVNGMPNYTSTDDIKALNGAMTMIETEVSIPSDFEGMRSFYGKVKVYDQTTGRSAEAVNETIVEIILPPSVDSGVYLSVNAEEFYPNDTVEFFTAYTEEDQITAKEWVIVNDKGTTVKAGRGNIIDSIKAGELGYGKFKAVQRIKYKRFDGSTGRKEATVSFVVNNLPPIASFSMLDEAYVEDLISLINYSKDPDGYIARVTWEIMNASKTKTFVKYEYKEGGVNKITHQDENIVPLANLDYKDEGSYLISDGNQGVYNVRLKVWDNSGASDEETKLIRIKRRPLTADFATLPKEQEITEDITLLDLASSYDTKEWFISKHGEDNYEPLIVRDKNIKEQLFTKDTIGKYDIKLVVSNALEGTREKVRTVTFVPKANIEYDVSPVKQFTQEGITLNDTSNDAFNVKYEIREKGLTDFRPLILSPTNTFTESVENKYETQLTANYIDCDYDVSYVYSTDRATLLAIENPDTPTDTWVENKHGSNFKIVEESAQWISKGVEIGNFLDPDGNTVKYRRKLAYTFRETKTKNIIKTVEFIEPVPWAYFEIIYDQNRVFKKITLDGTKSTEKSVELYRRLHPGATNIIDAFKAGERHTVDYTSDETVFVIEGLDGSGNYDSNLDQYIKGPGKTTYDSRVAFTAKDIQYVRFDLDATYRVKYKVSNSRNSSDWSQWIELTINDDLPPVVNLEVLDKVVYRDDNNELKVKIRVKVTYSSVDGDYINTSKNKVYIKDNGNTLDDVFGTRKEYPGETDETIKILESETTIGPNEAIYVIEIGNDEGNLLGKYLFDLEVTEEVTIPNYEEDGLGVTPRESSNTFLQEELNKVALIDNQKPTIRIKTTKSNTVEVWLIENVNDPNHKFTDAQLEQLLQFLKNQQTTTIIYKVNEDGTVTEYKLED